jgi:hypothetical protein
MDEDATIRWVIPDLKRVDRVLSAVIKDLEGGRLKFAQTTLDFMQMRLHQLGEVVGQAIQAPTPEVEVL